MTLIIDEKFQQAAMRSAIAEAVKAFDSGEIPVGAVVYKEGKPVGKGYNQREKLGDPTAHAEVIAISAAANTLGDWRLNDCQIFVTKEPCPMCAGAIVNARISYVGFGAWDDRAGCCGSLYQLTNEPRFNHQAVVRGGILEEDCAALLKEFFFLQRSKKQ